MKKSHAIGMILIAVILMDLLTGMEFDLFVPSFPQLQSHFSLTPFWVEALLSVNFIGYSLSLFFVGGLADRYGRKPIILIGLITFVIGSVLCLCETVYSFLLMGRFLQGMGIAAPAILSFLIIADAYPIKQQQFLFAMLNGSLNTAAAAAPVIGSYIALYFHWQGNFMALLMLGLITLVMTLFFIPSYQLPKHQEIILPHGYIQLFRSKPLILLITTLLFIFVPYWIFVGMSPLLYIKDLGVSLHYFGLYQGVLALVFAIGSVLYGFMIKNKEYSQRKMLVATNLILITSLIMILILCFFNTKAPLLITIAITLFVIGQIIPSTLLYPICVNFIPEAKGKISAMLQGGRLIVSATALQIAGFFYFGSFRNIGIIIASFIFIAVIMLFFTIKNRKLTSHISAA
ncbi:MAG: MFS transporter [Gammaproteobacteria bacterium CG_4_10_14_0_8_um_filter_38_16]|nr:MAG: MFS transporter [Gammaproteobacteria bacterium CG_4_10_14_0_8_um_filter_38_16]PJA04055.1 MAG: MFS transporter [Gammaproteobacteria bacterium CG_4_10_14_0_2_um_filter_38_22]PJB09593.1 MAG: MFS transporter [Gammaproteobacteria bacterium CG_4_9_14_3_um_filter_38_9]